MFIYRLSLPDCRREPSMDYPGPFGSLGRLHFALASIPHFISFYAVPIVHSRRKVLAHALAKRLCSPAFAEFLDRPHACYKNGMNCTRDGRKTIVIQRNAYSSSSSSSPPASFLEAAAARLRLTRPARPPPYGEVRAKSMCFCESRRTTNDGTFTICLPTLYRNESAIDH
jgi:hypothetical protein